MKRSSIALLEIDVPIITETFINYSAGIWHNTLSDNLGQSGITITGSDGTVGFYASQPTILLYRVGSLKIDNEDYTQVYSFGDLESQDSSFYYEVSTRRIFYHFAGFTVPWGKLVRIGMIIGYSDRVGETNGAYYDDIYYEPRIASIPALKKSKDPIFYGILQYTGGSVNLIDSDGEIAALFDGEELIGQPARVYTGYDGDAFADFRKAFSGNVEDYSYNRDSFSLQIMDNRKFLSRSIPVRKFEAAEFPDMDEDDLGNVKPLAWGSIRNAELVCVNPNGATPWRFYVCDVTDHAITGVTTVYLKGIALAGVDWSYADGIVSIATGVFVSDDHDDYYIEDNLGDVTADFTGFAGITLGLDVITDILDTYAQISYLAANFNTTEWAAALADSRTVGILLNEETKINEVIGKICVAEDGIFLVQDDGKYTFRKYDETRAISKTIYTDEWIDEPAVKKESKELLSSVKINYNRNHADDKWHTYNNATYEDDVQAQYKTLAEKKFDTVLATEAGAIEKSESIMARSKEMTPTVTRKTKMQNIDLEVMDFIEAEHDRESATTKTWNIYEVIGINKDLNSHEIGLTMKYVAESLYLAHEDGLVVDDEGDLIRVIM